MRVIENIHEMRDWSEAERCAGRRIVLVPTMGALHEGHLSLVREGKKGGERLVASLFVNPAQFSPNEDLAGYPRVFERDREMLEKEKVDILFKPSAAEMYPEGYQTYVDVERLGPLLCGEFRPGHFPGVATVVAKLFNIVRPHAAIFGEKDYQQIRVIRRMAKDLNFDVDVVGYPTVREKDGLAMSSRNVYLSRQERAAALSLSRSLKQAESLVRQGERESKRIVAAVRAEIEKETLARIEYARVCDTGTLEEVATVEGAAVLSLAVRVGKSRLIDNTTLKP